MHFFALLAIAAISSSARAFTINSSEEFNESPQAVVGNPGPPPGVADKCKRDLLIILDMSYSIGKSTFDKKIKSFLKNLSRDSTLNVGPHGTQLAIIVFSNTARTKVFLEFGQRISQVDFENLIDSMDWDTLSGDRTRTGYAFLKANEVFLQNSPYNVRQNIPDIVMMMTDGQPNGPGPTGLEEKTAYKYAEALRDKGVLIIGIAFGPKRHQFKDKIVKMVNSTNNTFDAEFDKLDTIINKVVDASCKSPGDCNCVVSASDFFVPPGQTTLEVSWVEPKLECKNDQTTNLRPTVSPNVKSPHKFNLGHQRINYTYTIREFPIKCYVEFNIFIIPCQGQNYDPAMKICCCGKLWTKKPGWMCCGKEYYDTLIKKCCPAFYNLVAPSASCPGDNITS